VGATEKGFTTWGYTKEALDYWALLFREWLDRFHGKTIAGGAGKNNYLPFRLLTY
jgi:hypothetical protein